MKYICLIKYIKSVLWRVAKRLSRIEDPRCLKVNPVGLVRVCPPTVLAQPWSNDVTFSIITVQRQETRAAGRNDKDKLTVYIAVFLINIIWSRFATNTCFLITYGSPKHKLSARMKNWNEEVTRIYSREQQEDGWSHIIRHVHGLNTVVFRPTCDLFGSAFGSGTALQARRLWIRFPMGTLYFLFT